MFYGHMFHWYGWGDLLLPALATLLPALVFALGSGWLLGQIRPWLVYVWMAVPLPEYGLAVARRPGNLERTFFQQVPSSTWYLRPRLLYAGRSSDRSVHTVGCGHRPVDGSPRTIQKIRNGRNWMMGGALFGKFIILSFRTMKKPFIAKRIILYDDHIKNHLPGDGKRKKPSFSRQ